MKKILFALLILFSVPAQAKTDAEIIAELTTYCDQKPKDCADAILNYAYHSLDLQNQLLEALYQVELQKWQIRKLKRKLKAALK
jgi:hypothetical protein